MAEDVSRVFKNDKGKLMPLKHGKFSNEKILQNLIEDNLGVVFDGLSLLDTEFQYGDLRPDSVAYDSENDCFVIVEYKNVKNKQVMDQGMSYYWLLKEHIAQFVLLYNKKKNEQRQADDFNLEESYIIFISPEFLKYQTYASHAMPNLPVRLYQISQYDDVIILKRINRTEDKPRQKSNYSGEWNEDDYLDGKYGASRAPSGTRKLFKDVRDKILDCFEDMEAIQKKQYLGFYYKPNSNLICGMRLQKSKVIVGCREYKNIPDPTAEVRRSDNKYYFAIKSIKDMDHVLADLKNVYEYKKEKI